ncbi:MAG TPA: adenosylcobinamide-phosphate synthase CbiB [Candidatus Hungatella pullicola]|nr:adenosylcobinamide-phosphate synthase CbiB [Candidatus Hungatella pullicola]
MIHSAAVFAGCFLDFLFGDPRWLPHPVCGMGRMISGYERMLRNLFPEGEKGEKKAGFCLVCLVLLSTGLIAGAVLWTAYSLSFWIGVVAETVLCYQMMAWRSLGKESMKVYRHLKDGNVEEARQAVSMIVGRDTKKLTEEGIAKAAVETVAENTSDGVIAPLFYMILFGGLGGCLYKAVNTMDSMVGYKNEKYLWLGRYAARLDDLVNLIPARLSALLMLGGSFLCRIAVPKEEKEFYSPGNGWRIFRRDRYNHKSPNSAQTESVCAGVLGLQLAGDAWYFGSLVKKPFIGDPVRKTGFEDIKRANCLMNGCYVLALCLAFLAGRIV